ncbi:hypothetical protein CPB83DRAFT_857573 [Crepidotus variabilis]|uniref:Secreted protein n=1 Tax=Crepidotus variabilis TaxID=179855 RepID=A0A9P6JMZ9_9AGAR|nr:hypothetical protein CPB83DRAFT_857573 [Crepidotus variabilis]
MNSCSLYLSVSLAFILESSSGINYTTRRIHATHAISWKTFVRLKLELLVSMWRRKRRLAIREEGAITSSGNMPQSSSLRMTEMERLGALLVCSHLPAEAYRANAVHNPNLV